MVHLRGGHFEIVHSRTPDFRDSSIGIEDGVRLDRKGKTFGLPDVNGTFESHDGSRPSSRERVVKSAIVEDAVNRRRCLARNCRFACSFVVFGFEA